MTKDDTAIGTRVSRVLTEMRQQPTQVEPQTIGAWANWLNLETLNDPQLLHLVECAAKWCLRLKHGLQPSWLTLIGPSGVGKTHVCQRVWQWAKQRVDWRNTDYQHGKIYWPAFIEELRDGSAYHRFRDMWNWPVLFLDDIGAERDNTGYASEKLNTLLGTRVGKWTVITSNKSLEQLADIDARIADRIIREPGNVYAEIDTVSYGIRKQGGQHEEPATL